MKKIFTSIILAASVLVGCKEDIQQPKGHGSFAVSIDEISDKYVTKSEIILDANEFDYSIVDSEGGVYSSGKVGEMPNVFEEVPSGTYTINVSSVDKKVAAFDQPIIAGSTEFKVKPMEITSVQVACTIQNVKVSIVPDDQFFTELASYTISVSNGKEAENMLIWTNGEVTDPNYEYLTKENVLEARSGYFTVASGLDIYVTGVRNSSDSEPASYEGVIAPIAAKDHYIVKLSAKTTGQVGGGDGKPGISITVDYTTVNKEENVEIPGFEDVPVDGPGDGSSGGGYLGELKLEWPNNPNYDIYPLKSSYPEGIALKVIAEDYISSFQVKIKSDYDVFMQTVQVQMAAELDENGYAVLDLMTNETAVGALAALGLPTGDNLKGQPEIEFNITGLVPMITNIPPGPAVGSKHAFLMVVTDMAGQVLEQELVFEYRGEEAN